MNYYAVRNRPTIESPIHIGKSSYGWLFCFQTQNETWRDTPVVWNTFDQVKDWLYKHTVEKEEYVILDEEDTIIPYDQFIKLVEDKQKDEFCFSNSDNFKYSLNVNGYRFSDRQFT